jgi:bifunctional pyridoxal-dependent enzyme with beta-cystathionase and maltose regulon repressor activities
MKFLAVVLALVAPATSFSFNGAPLRQSTSIASTSTLERQTIKSGARSMTMMPIGVPKVAYKMPGSRGGEWVDIYNRLTRERIIFMGAEIDDEMANQIIGVLLVSIIFRTTTSVSACFASIKPYIPSD